MTETESVMRGGASAQPIVQCMPSFLQPFRRLTDLVCFLSFKISSMSLVVASIEPCECVQLQVGRAGRHVFNRSSSATAGETLSLNEQAQRALHRLKGGVAGWLAGVHTMEKLVANADRLHVCFGPYATPFLWSRIKLILRHLWQ